LLINLFAIFIIYREKQRESKIRESKIDRESITPERQRIAKILKNHIEKAVDELGPGYTVNLQGNFYDTPNRITIKISPIN
jgi:hypothetical protein